MVPHLIPLDGTSPIPVDKPILFFGRHPDCDIVLTNSRKVSRKHCCLAVIDNYLVIRDLGSMNGLRVNGNAVKKESRVNIGDEIHVGDVGFRVELSVSEKKRGQAAPAQPKAKVPPKVDARFLSQELPVAINEQPAEFMVEETLARQPVPPRKKPNDSDDVIQLRDSDVIDDG
jgi:pSer/pThr/pTyr-binding forkhead associated (FHA) protein